MIAQAVEQIRNTVSLSVLDESATKQGVVLNLLRLAGWDTFDVSQVVPEYTVGTGRVDYVSLFRIYRPVNWEMFRIYLPDFQGH